MVGWTPPPLDALVRLMSVRNKYGACRVRSEVVAQVDAYVAEEGAARRAPAMLNTDSQQPLDVTNTCDGIDMVRQLVEVLAPVRAEGYESWMRVGWCLRNIDHRLLSDWIKFSRRSSKYVEGECDAKWARISAALCGLKSMPQGAAISCAPGSKNRNRVASSVSVRGSNLNGVRCPIVFA